MSDVMITPDGYQPVGALPISGIAKIHREADLAEEDLIKANAAKRLAEMQKPTLEVVGEAIGQLSHRIFGGGDKEETPTKPAAIVETIAEEEEEEVEMEAPAAAPSQAEPVVEAESPAVADEPVVIEEPTKEAQPPAEAPAVDDEAKEAASTSTTPPPKRRSSVGAITAPVGKATSGILRRMSNAAQATIDEIDELVNGPPPKR